ncbi:MAG: histidine phosphatase family protein [Candidatus Omnitrophota bacterium]
MSTKLILIRHGETVWNAKKRYCGTNDIGLSKKGKIQAEKLRHRLKDEIVHRVYTSDRKRAVQTAKIIFNGSKVIEKIPDLREIHFGRFEGLTHKQILRKYAAVYKKWLSDPYKNHAPKGEKLIDFRKRVISEFKAITRKNSGRSTAIVCHGGVISVFITHILGKKDFWKHIPHSASITIIEYKNRKLKIALFNDTNHLN